MDCFFFVFFLLLFNFFLVFSCCFLFCSFVVVFAGNITLTKSCKCFTIFMRFARLYSTFKEGDEYRICFAWLHIVALVFFLSKYTIVSFNLSTNIANFQPFTT